MTTRPPAAALALAACRSRRGAVVLVGLLGTSSGCTVVRELRPSELVKLDGYFVPGPAQVAPPPRAYTIADVDGTSFPFDSTSLLEITSTAKGVTATHAGYYRNIRVSGGWFEGIERDSSYVVRVPLDSIDKAGIRRFSPYATAALVAGGALVLGLAGFVYLAHGGVQ